MPKFLISLSLEPMTLSKPARHKSFTGIWLALLTGLMRDQSIILQLSKRTTIFWFHFIPTHQEPIRRRLLDGFPVLYLDRFLLNLKFIQLTFNEIRLIIVNDENQPPGFPPSYHFISVPGRSYHFEWSTSIWTTSITSHKKPLSCISCYPKMWTPPKCSPSPSYIACHSCQTLDPATIVHDLSHSTHIPASMETSFLKTPI